MAKQNIEDIKNGLVQHDCIDCDEHWYTRLSQEQKERALAEREMA
jgi:hypothetical protein